MGSTKLASAASRLHEVSDGLVGRKPAELTRSEQVAVCKKLNWTEAQFDAVFQHATKHASAFVGAKTVEDVGGFQRPSATVSRTRVSGPEKSATNVMQDAKYDVVILGAGVAGLKAAAECLEAGMRVHIVEAGNRLGGRTKTDINEFGEPVSHGAQWLHEYRSHPLYKECLKLGFDPIKEICKEKFIGYSEGMLGAIDIFSEAIDKARQEGIDITVSNFVDGLDVANEHKEPLKKYWGAISSGDPYKHSIATCFKEFVDDAYVNEGLGTIVEAYGKGLFAKYAGQLSIEFNAPVSKVDPNGKPATVLTPKGERSAQAVISTLPSNVLARVGQDFGLSTDRIDAIKTRPLGNWNKLIVQLKTNVLKEVVAGENPYINVKDPETGAIMCFYLHSENKHDGEALIVGFNADGPGADEIDAMGPEKAIEHTKHMLGLLVGHDTVEKHFVKGAVTDWAKQETAGGVWAVLAPGWERATDLAIRPLNGTFFIAGDWASDPANDRFGTTGGAMEAATRAAKEVKAQFKKDAWSPWWKAKPLTGWAENKAKAAADLAKFGEDPTTHQLRERKL